jgi:hypothetical protein
LFAPVLAVLALGNPADGAAGAQQEEQLASSVVAGLAKAIADAPVTVRLRKPGRPATVARRDVAAHRAR